VTAMPSQAEIRAQRLFLLAKRERYGLAPYDPDEFAGEFRLMTVQRCLKACGTFSFQTGVRGRVDPYAQFIQPMLAITLQAAEWFRAGVVARRQRPRSRRRARAQRRRG